MSDSAIVTFALIAAVAGIAYGLYLAMWVFKLNAGNVKMPEISKASQEGAGAANIKPSAWSRRSCSSSSPPQVPFRTSSGF